MLSSHPSTCYLCKEKCRYYPRTRGIGDREEVQGHPLSFLETPIPSATQHECRERARDCTSRPAESEKEKDQDGQVPGADDIPSKYGEPEGFSWKLKREKIESAYVVGCRFLLEMPTDNDPTSLPQSLLT